MLVGRVGVEGCFDNGRSEGGAEFCGVELQGTDFVRMRDDVA